MADLVPEVIEMLKILLVHFLFTATENHAQTTVVICPNNCKKISSITTRKVI